MVFCLFNKDKGVIFRLGIGVAPLRDLLLFFSVRPPQAGQSGRQKQQNFTNLSYAFSKSDHVLLFFKMCSVEVSLSRDTMRGFRRRGSFSSHVDDLDNRGRLSSVSNPFGARESAST